MPRPTLQNVSADERGSFSQWGQILAFLVLVNAATWLACISLRPIFAAGHLWALFTFIYVTVWSPTVVSLALAFCFEGSSGVRGLLGLLFRRFSNKYAWYLIGVAVPIVAIVVAVTIARRLHAGANFLPYAALPLTLALQVSTGAAGEELGWRGWLLSHLEGKLTPRVAALIMAIMWALWHLPAFFFPGMPQQQMPPAAFLLMVAAFGIFLALLFNRTQNHLVSTMLAHLTFNIGLAVGGAALGSILIWTLAGVFLIVALFSLINFSVNTVRSM